VEAERKTDEIKRLQRSINDLVSVLALPAIWTGHESSLVATTLIDVLVRMLRLDFAYVRTTDSIDESPKEWIRSDNGSHRAAQAHEIGRALEPYLAENPSRASLRIANPLADGTAFITVFHLGLQEKVGVFVAGSRRPEFPTVTERLLLQVAMNQAAIALQEARYVSQRRRTTEDLERRVIERTAELSAVNEALRQEIVERTRAEEELQQSEAQFQLAIDTIPGLVWTALPDGHIDYLNQRWREYTGLSLGEAGGWGWQVAIHPEDVAGLVEYWSSVLAAGKAGETEARLRRFDGEYRWFLFRGVPLCDGTGKLVKWYGQTTDIDERKRAEERGMALQRDLASERDRLRLLLDINEALVANLDLRSLFKALAVSLRRVTDCDFVGLALPEPVTGKLRQHLVDYREGQGAITEGMIVPLQGSASGKAFRTRQLVCLDSVQGDGADPEIYGTQEGENFYQILLKEGVPAGYFLPLIKGGNVIAVMQLTKYAGGPLKTQQTEFLSALASQLSVAVANALEHRAVVASRDQLARERVYLREEIDRSSMFEEIVGSSEPLRKVLSQVSKVAPTNATVLILGETGTGKELIARAIHKRSKRSSRAFVGVNCAAIPAPLIASELFGHEKGAFTGAVQRRLGRFELADGGTIFLDEIGDLPMEMQLALLRVLQEREFERMGGSQSISVDVRVVAATNRDLKAAVAAGTFREDLFYRLNVFPIRIPSLRERVNDIPLLVEYLIDRYAKKTGKNIKNIERRTVDLFETYKWPGNIREMQNVVERAVILCEGETFSVDETWLTLEPQHVPSASGLPLRGLLRLDEGQEREMIETALEESGGRISGTSGAASKLGIPRQTLESKIANLGIDKHRFKSA
jgi:formate hydrogenlyase transcriptional activator